MLRLRARPALSDAERAAQEAGRHALREVVREYGFIDEDGVINLIDSDSDSSDGDGDDDDGDVGFVVGDGGDSGTATASASSVRVKLEDAALAAAEKRLATATEQAQPCTARMVMATHDDEVLTAVTPVIKKLHRLRAGRRRLPQKTTSTTAWAAGQKDAHKLPTGKALTNQ